MPALKRRSSPTAVLRSAVLRPPGGHMAECVGGEKGKCARGGKKS